MRMHRSFSFAVACVALALMWGGTPSVLSAQAITPRADSFIQTQWSNFLQSSVGVRISEGVDGLAYLFRPTHKATPNVWLRREHPELWRSTREEREAGKAALPLVGGLAILALLAWGGRRVLRGRRSESTSATRERRDRHTPVAFAGGQ